MDLYIVFGTIFIFLIIFLFIYKKISKKKSYDELSYVAKRLDSMLIESVDDNLWSSNRFSLLYTLFLSNVVVWIGIAMLLIINEKFPAIPESIIVLYGLANGIYSIAKVAQKREERLIEQLETKKLDSKDTEEDVK